MFIVVTYIWIQELLTGFVIRLIFFFPKEGLACVHPDRRWRGEGRARRGWKEPWMEEYYTPPPPMPVFLPGFVYRGLAVEMHGFLLIWLATPNKVSYWPDAARHHRDWRRKKQC